MSAREELIQKLRAGYCYFYFQTDEMNRCIEDLREINENYKAEVWDFSNNPDPHSLIPILQESEINTVVLAKNLNWFLADYAGDLDKTLVTFLQNMAPVFSSREFRKALVIVSDAEFEKAIPPALQKDFNIIKYGLPTVSEIKEILDGICDSARTSSKFKEPTDDDKALIIQEMKGLTAREIENALSYTLIKHEGSFNLKTLAKIKAVEIERTAGLKLGEYKETFDDLKGYEKIKEFVMATINSPLALGIMLLGPPGTGKTMFAKAVSNMSKKKMFVMEVAELFGGLVGESEKLMRKALDFVRANAPCILFIDELEKALAGVGNTRNEGGETTKRSLSQLLKFLSDDRPEGVYVIATCNNISQLPPEWVRAERWDTAPFFIDLPTEQERDPILESYLEKYNVSGEPPKMEGWSGAEIKGMCRIASMMGKKINEVSDFIVPVSETMKVEIALLREWAKGKTIAASKISFPKMSPEVAARAKRDIGLN